MIMSVLKSEDSTFCLVIAASTSAPDQKDHLKSFVEKNGAGVQHIAFHCDITTALENLKKTEIRIITPPKSYYSRDHVKETLKVLGESESLIKEQKILIDFENLDERKILLQAFTEPIFNNGTFFEFIKRWNGSIDFGKHNVKALWEGIEEEHGQ